VLLQARKWIADSAHTSLHRRAVADRTENNALLGPSGKLGLRACGEQQQLEAAGATAVAAAYVQHLIDNTGTAAVCAILRSLLTAGCLVTRRVLQI
jgi:hypothetical protein